MKTTPKSLRFGATQLPVGRWEKCLRTAPSPTNLSVSPCNVRTYLWNVCQSVNSQEFEGLQSAPRAEVLLQLRHISVSCCHHDSGSGGNEWRGGGHEECLPGTANIDLLLC
mmetsp:Transcript_39450/g.61510  ORF Transcript_39450/g.61510 Transcript_39450/m.61510 type:complete len:111 (+) Transcript_39450:768-1100(+)